MARFDVILPAGGTLEEGFQKVVGVNNKALISIGGRTILARTIEALRGCTRVGRICLVGSPEVLAHDDSRLADFVLPAAGHSAPANIGLGLRELAQVDFPPETVLLVTNDLPFLTAGALDYFLDLCAEGVDFQVPLIARSDWDEAFPGAEATFAQLSDGQWTTGCVYLATVKGLAIAMPHLEEVFANRKSKLKMAMQLGPKFVWDYMSRKLTVDEIEQKIMEMLNVRGSAIPGSPAALAYDVDYVEDYQYAVTVAAARRV